MLLICTGPSEQMADLPAIILSHAYTHGQKVPAPLTACLQIDVPFKASF